MAAVKLVTRCPACRTAFRLVADQLRLRQGLVRCGHCETVFDAREHLIEIPLPAGSATPPAAAEPATTTHPAATPAPAAEALRPGEPAAAPQPAPEPFTPTIDPGYDVPALDAPTMLMTSPEDLDAPVPAPADEDVHEDEIERALREANEAVAQRDAREAERQADVEPVPQQTPAAQTVPEAEPVAEPQAEQQAEPEAQPEPDREATPDADATASQAAPQPAAAEAAAPAWPALNHNALDHPALDEPAEIGKTAEAEAEAEAEAKAEAPAPQPGAVPAPAAIPSASEFLRAASADIGPPPAIPPSPAGTPEAAAEPPGSEAAESTDTGEPASTTGEAVAREQTTRRWTRAEPPAGPVFAPDFLRHTRERERERAPARSRAPAPRTLWYVAAAVLALGAAVQAVYLARSPLAGQFPMLRPALEAACAPFGCDVPPWRDIDALRIETSQLQRLDEGGDAYMLAVTLRNLGRASTALPAIELVMTDLQDQLLLRRVLQPADYLDPSQKAFATEGLRAGMELPVRVRFRTQQAPSNYRVLIFYP
ncbi:DUF3426 domain-containing protein [Cupriavidus oxalaticus]|uniref:DUF3426 domain-containing protein n=1 Tax=Cupriavidus oxalaticus TaxID=96344 RepID=A0A375G5F1_9BURK|nr:DUF3426 domain-containing protein [Cupriavidus oxalaticus]QEZ47788.1 DUF3426 domain-containing protein [Cupriavidus oxalaticus]QRQ87891.1 zinc-ribbon domain-containing protein [Cupriavidus oxalaticus]QRQ93782.1 zinc-ribbon domain-containing protein [Cupriavidus oxalaticus]WQD82410.1 DUF3426 domain-containing protein [Cupriavidus oxalaticus]SPC14871.1 conserved hypothetical protein [Cupriavidus oxalaticus]